MTDPDNIEQKTAPDVYRVLARKYRPTVFAELIGQEPMVRTLTNAMAAGRLAHAFILTGVRGVGKTTTARLIARALNCIGADGAGGPTIAPCGVCEHCRSIAEDRHVDVLEMDAASRTGIDDIRELIDGARYRPTSARFKIYIIDEVHMLSKPAFNALLKTLEEPPGHVKFIFATTETRRVPVTVLSRCQRFDLRRVDRAALSAHFAAIAEKEQARVEPAALALLARAADGSVRDGLSLLDQAIAHGGAEVTEIQVRDMLGLADRERIVDLFEAVMKGDMVAALDMVAELYRDGADPAVVVQDLLEFTHWLTRLKAAPGAASAQPVSESHRVRGGAMAKALSMAVLARTWQMLLKGLGEVRTAPSPMQAVEMLLVRLAYAADLPPPAEIIAELKSKTGSNTKAGSNTKTGSAGSFVSAGSASTSGPSASAPPPAKTSARETQASLPPSDGSGARLAVAQDAEIAPEPSQVAALPSPASFEAVVELFSINREALLHAHLINDIHLVAFEPGRIEFAPGPYAPATLANRMDELLRHWTGRRWSIVVSAAEGAKTLRAQAEDQASRRHAQAAAEPLVRAVMAAFPGATIEAVRDLGLVDDPKGDPDVATPDSEMMVDNNAPLNGDLDP